MLDVITNGTQLWSSLPLSPVSTTLTLHLLSHETRPLHSAVSVWTGDKAVAPSGCTSPTQAQLLPTVDTGLYTTLSNNVTSDLKTIHTVEIITIN